MLAVYNSASICAFDEPLKCGLRLDPGIVLILCSQKHFIIFRINVREIIKIEFI